MAFENMPLREYFFLKDRESLSLDPWKDQDVFFGPRKIDDRIRARIDTDFVKPRGVPKFFVHGAFGSGKTHALAHVQHVLLKNQMYPTDPIYIDIAPLVAKEKFERIHGRLVDAIGLDRIRGAAEAVADGGGTDKIEAFKKTLRFGDEALRASQANVFRNLLFGGRQAQMSWEWLKGKKMSVNDAQTLGTQKELGDAQDFVFCLLNIGELYYRGAKKRIVFLVDEAEAFRSVTNPDSLTELRHALRQLLENANSYVGFVFAIQVEGGQEDVGDFFSSEEIRRRVDYDSGFIDLNGLVAHIDDARDFVKALLSRLVDQGAAAEAIEKEKLGTTPEWFPFTEEAVEHLSKHVSDNHERQLPAAIISWMSNAAIDAWRKRADSAVHQLVTAEIVESVVYPG